MLICKIFCKLVLAQKVWAKRLLVNLFEQASLVQYYRVFSPQHSVSNQKNMGIIWKNFQYAQIIWRYTPKTKLRFRFRQIRIVFFFNNICCYFSIFSFKGKLLLLIGVLGNLSRGKTSSK